jgi:outer membrane cobalamin receptor
VTNGKSNVRVIDRSDIERSGGADINQTLRELGANR